MATFLDEIFSPLTATLVGVMGKSITFTAVGEGADYNTATSRAEPSADPRQVQAIIEEFRGQELNGDLIQIGDKKVSIAGAIFTTPPMPGDEVRIDAVDFTVMAVGAIYSGDLVALYVLTCRRG